jgi:tetratricopeptide (TPR) repeat protein
MHQARSPVFSSLRLVALVACLACLPAHADEYSEVSQLVRAGKLAEALTRADQYLATQAKDPQMRFIKGVIQRDSGKTTEAIATFTKLTEDFPELPEPYNNLAVLYAGQSQFDKARSALEMAIRTNPSYATAHENLGDIYAKLASQAYNKALQLDSANPAVPPKLALIREIFSANASKAPRVASTPAPVPVTATVVAQNGLGKPASTPPPAVVPPAVQPPAAAPAPKVAASAPATKALPPVAASSEAAGQVQEVEAAVAKWAKAWSARDVKSYLAAYGRDFDPPGSVNRKTWEEERQLRITSKASITVKVEGLSVHVSGNHATAKFRQDYKAGGLAVSSRKTLDFAKVGEHWQIVKETVGN